MVDTHKVIYSDVSNSEYNFDYKQDGFLEKTPWAAQGDGVLIADLNHNGTVDGETELLSINQVACDLTPLHRERIKSTSGKNLLCQLITLNRIIRLRVKTPNSRHFAQKTELLLKNIA